MLGEPSPPSASPPKEARPEDLARLESSPPDKLGLWYHGSHHYFDRFEQQTRHTFGKHPSLTPIFLTKDPSTARAHAGANGWVYTVRPSPHRVFDINSILVNGEWPRYWPPEADQLTEVGKRLLLDLEAGRIFGEPPEDAADILRSIALSYYSTMESSEFKEWLMANGFDAFYVREAPNAPLSLAVMDVRDIEIVSATRATEVRLSANASALPFVGDVTAAVLANDAYRRVLYTDGKSQIVAMSLVPGEEIGAEVHPHTEQTITVAAGTALILMGPEDYMVGPGQTVVVPPGTRHNVINVGAVPLKLSSTYTPPEHPEGLVQWSKLVT